MCGSHTYSLSRDAVSIRVNGGATLPKTGAGTYSNGVESFTESHAGASSPDPCGGTWDGPLGLLQGTVHYE